MPKLTLLIGLYFGIVVCCLGQTASLSLVGGVAVPRGTVTLPLTLASAGGQPAALQWRLNYSSLDVSSIEVGVGPVASAAGKAVQCNAKPGFTICILAGINKAVMANGIAATVTVHLAAAPTSTSIAISVTDALGASLAATAIPTLGSAATVNVSTPPPPPLVSVDPGKPEVSAIAPMSGSGPSGRFTATFSHGGGAGQLYLGYVLFLPTSNNVWYTAKGSCLIEYNRISNGMRLIDDAGTGWLGPISGVVLGPNAANLSNDQCTVELSGATISLGAKTMVVSVPVTFKNALSPVVGTFLQALDVTGVWTGMTQFGNWVLPGGRPRPGPSIAGVANSTNSGSYAVYTTTASHTSGSGSLSMIHLLVGTHISDPAPCQVVYFPGSKTLNLINDTGSQLVSPTGAPVGISGSLANSRCSVNTRLASQSVSANTVTVTIPLNLQTSTFAGTKNVYVNAFDAAGELTHWVQAATLNVQ
jgi:hypothetical protein